MKKKKDASLSSDFACAHHPIPENGLSIAAIRRVACAVPVHVAFRAAKTARDLIVAGLALERAIIWVARIIHEMISCLAKRQVIVQGIALAISQIITIRAVLLDSLGLALAVNS